MSLVPRFTLGALDLTDYPYSIRRGSDGADLGNPQPVTDILASLLADGEIESSSRRSNRTVTIPLYIEGADLAELADAEAALIAECDRQRNVLTVDPGDGFGATTAFDTFAATAARSYDDDFETALLREWTLTIQALPFGRSVNLISDDAGTPPSSGGTLLYNCQSTTGWSGWSVGGGTTPGTFAVDSTVFSEGTGSLKSLTLSWDQGFDSHFASGASLDQVTGLSLSTGAGGYLATDVRLQYEDALSGFLPPGLWAVSMQVAGVWTEAPSPIATKRDALGFITYVWPVDGGLTVTGLRFTTLQSKMAQFVDPPYTWYDNVQLLPAATTDHQIAKTLTVEGSARTPASLRVAAPSESVALGQVLAVTVPSAEIPSGFQPDGRRWLTNGTPTTDATALGGSYLTPHSSAYTAGSTYPVFDIPVGMLSAGAYTMVGLVKAESSSLTFGVQAQLNMDGTLVGPTSEAETSPTGLTTGWQFVTVGTVYLPPLPVQNADDTTTVRLIFKGAKMADVYFIPAWRVGGRLVADFSIVNCGTGTVEPGGASSSLWIDSPSVLQPQGGWWRGPTDDRANSQSAWPDAKKPGVHTFQPGSLTAFLVSTGAAGPTLTLEYYKAWHGMAGS